MDLKLQLEFAYRKLKSFVYHENFSLDLRMEIANFEQSKVENKLIELEKNIQDFILTGKTDEILKQITYSVFPKRLVTIQSQFQLEQSTA